MKKSVWIIIGIVVVIAVLVGGYAILYKAPKKTMNSNSTTQTKAPAVNNSVLITKNNAKLGQYLADPSGKALYTYGGDSSGVSKCTGSCLTSWPAYQAVGLTTSLPQGISVITRSDNSQTQYAYNGMPLYYFASDSSGQVTGNGVSNFSIAAPAAASSQPAAAPNTSSSSGYSY